VSAAARSAVRTRLTALRHHVDVEALERAFRRQKRQASAGVDGITVAGYERSLAGNLQDLCARVHTGRDRPQPVRRVDLPKAEGGRRPLGVPTLEDKIVQGAVAETLSAIDEVDLLGLSYGFRPGRNPRQALASLHTAIMSQRVSRVLDADIRSFLGSVDHEWLLRMLAHRIADPRVLRLVRMWLAAGILEGDAWHATDRGTPQGAGISPLLANIFLHDALDLRGHQWRRRQARGRVSIVRGARPRAGPVGFADTPSGGSAAGRWAGPGGRRPRDGPREAARCAADAGPPRAAPGQVRPAAARGQDAPDRARPLGGPGSAATRRAATFAFLGLTHDGGWTRDGRLIVKHKTRSHRPTRKLPAVRREAWRPMHAPLAEQHRCYASILRGHCGDFGRPHDWRSRDGLRRQIRRIWLDRPRRRSRKSRRMGRAWLEALTACSPLPRPRITHPRTPGAARCGWLPGSAGCGKAACPDR
jgi:retron-type reverse transcriptase